MNGSDDTRAPDNLDLEAIPTITFDQLKSAPVRYLHHASHNGTNYWIVELTDQSVAKVEQQSPSMPPLSQGVEQHTREYLLAWLDKTSGDQRPSQYFDFKRRIASDAQMLDFWQWLGTVQFNRSATLRNSLTVSDCIWRYSHLPTKPSNMTRAKRQAYFKRVTQHVEALVELLSCTRFDRVHTTELTDEELNKSLDSTLYHWGDDESDDGHVVAYLVDREGTYKFDYDYPDSALVETLQRVIEWTEWDDQWDGRIFGSSAPIVQENAESTPVIYFNCMLYEWFAHFGVELPFSILATVANVALELDQDKLVDEDTARKQVRRYQARATQKN